MLRVFSFLCNGVTFENLRHDGNKDDLMEFLILVLRKSASRSTFSLIIFVWISKTYRWKTFSLIIFVYIWGISRWKISFSMPCVVTSFKKIWLSLYFAWIVRVLDGFCVSLYLFGSSIFYTIGSKFRYWGIFRFITKFD